MIPTSQINKACQQLLKGLSFKPTSRGTAKKVARLLCLFPVLSSEIFCKLVKKNWKCSKLIGVCEHTCALLLTRILFPFQLFSSEVPSKGLNEKVCAFVGSANTCKHRHKLLLPTEIPLSTKCPYWNSAFTVILKRKALPLLFNILFIQLLMLLFQSIVTLIINLTRMLQVSSAFSSY